MMFPSALAALLLAASSGQSLYGLAVAGDGDSLTVGGDRIRLFGIDAPEFDQMCKKDGKSWACGSASAHYLSKLVTGREVRCQRMDTDQYQRIVARCTVGNIDINRYMVASGYAVAFRKYSTEYVAAEQSAKAAKRGIWAGTFEMPSEVRAAVRRQSTRAVQAKSPRAATAWAQRSHCVIKGNHSRRGDWIYHLPGMPYYEQTRPEEIFCTEAEAQAAGYRRAIVR